MQIPDHLIIGQRNAADFIAGGVAWPAGKIARCRTLHRSRDCGKPLMEASRKRVEQHLPDSEQSDQDACEEQQRIGLDTPCLHQHRTGQDSARHEQRNGENEQVYFGSD